MGRTKKMLHDHPRDQGFVGVPLPSKRPVRSACCWDGSVPARSSVCTWGRRAQLFLASGDLELVRADSARHKEPLGLSTLERAEDKAALDLDNKLLIVSCSLFLALCGAIGEATLPSFFNRTAMPRLCHNP